MADRPLVHQPLNLRYSEKTMTAGLETVFSDEQKGPLAMNSVKKRLNQEMPRAKSTKGQLGDNEERPGSSNVPNTNEKLYEAYEALHHLAQSFEKPFDSPAILVVGHQTDGKSALVEALMGFQFNSVGGGTKTRRPIALQMKYKSDCVTPICYLINDGGVEQEMPLEELQEHIEAENSRLEKESQFCAREIVARIEYKYCPNLTIIDTPGLISAVGSTKKGSASTTAADQVAAMVKSKMQQQEYIILCLEDTNDWCNATTRKLVCQVDPSLSRTVVVATKLDTKILQFSTANDAVMFLRPSSSVLEGNMLGGGPFFTSVPSGRVGHTKDSVYKTNDQFREALAEQEAQDVTDLEAKMRRKLDRSERSHVGVNQLRKFLEHILLRRYLENVPSIVTILEKEHRNAQDRLDSTQKDLQGLNPDKLREKARRFRESFLTKLQLLLRGTVAAPADIFGETLADEHIKGGAFTGKEGRLLPAPEGLPNAQMRLFGGAQFHRAMTEFRLELGRLQCPEVSKEEIVNACGIDDVHDGINYVRAACVIAVSKSKASFEPYVHQLGYRLSHVLRRLFAISVYLTEQDGLVLGNNHYFQHKLKSSYQQFIDEAERSCRNKVLEDLHSITRYVSWSLHSRSQQGLKNMLARVKLPPNLLSNATVTPAAGRDPKTPPPSFTESQAASVVFETLANTVWTRQLNQMSEEIVDCLVSQIFESIRDYIIQSAELKFNCFFLLPVVDTFPAQLREEVEYVLGEDLEDLFDVGTMRSNLEQRSKIQEAELMQVERLQRQFTQVHATLAQQEMSASTRRDWEDISGPGTGGGPTKMPSTDLLTTLTSRVSKLTMAARRPAEPSSFPLVSPTVSIAHWEQHTGAKASSLPSAPGSEPAQGVFTSAPRH